MVSGSTSETRPSCQVTAAIKPDEARFTPFSDLVVHHCDMRGRLAEGGKTPLRNNLPTSSRFYGMDFFRGVYKGQDTRLSGKREICHSIGSGNRVKIPDGDQRNR